MFFSFFGFIALHFLMYAINIYFWRRYRVNYSFIFGFKQGTELGYRQVLLLSFGIAVLALCCVLLNLDMEMDPKTREYKAFTELLPLNLVIVRFVNIYYMIFAPILLPNVCTNWSFSLSIHAASTYHIILAIQLPISLCSLLLPHMSLSLYCCSSLQGNKTVVVLHCLDNKHY